MFMVIFNVCSRGSPSNDALPVFVFSKPVIENSVPCIQINYLQKSQIAIDRNSYLGQSENMTSNIKMLA